MSSHKVLFEQKIDDTQQLRLWLQRDTFWHSLEKKARGILQGLKGMYGELPGKTKFFQWMECVRDGHHTSMFHVEVALKKTLAKGKEQEDLLEKPTRRLLYK